ncbi:hypothetical protein HK405_000969, partial [Cladochytrium tenue]
PPRTAAKLRQLPWTKLAAAQALASPGGGAAGASAGTVWAAAAHRRAGAAAAPDSATAAELEAAFAAAAAGQQQGALTGSAGDLAAASAPAVGWMGSKKQVALVDSKRAYNCAIMLSRVKVPFKDLREAVLAGDDAILPDALVRQFLQFVPTEDEAASIRAHVDRDAQTQQEKDGRLRSLGKAEQFFYEMSLVPRYQQRLEFLHFMQRFDERTAEVRQDILAVLQASNTLVQNATLVAALDAVLAAGNCLNANTFRGGAVGFSID